MMITHLSKPPENMNSIKEVYGIVGNAPVTFFVGNYLVTGWLSLFDLIWPPDFRGGQVRFYQQLFDCLAKGLECMVQRSVPCQPPDKSVHPSYFSQINQFSRSWSFLRFIAISSVGPELQKIPAYLKFLLFFQVTPAASVVQWQATILQERI